MPLRSALKYGLRSSWMVVTKIKKQGAERQMKVFSRLAAVAVAAGAVLASAGAAFAALEDAWEAALGDLAARYGP